MAARRSRRTNAGNNNMSRLLKAEEEDDDFYKTRSTYGDFTEVILVYKLVADPESRLGKYEAKILNLAVPCKVIVNGHF